MKVPFFDLQKQYLSLKDEIYRVIDNVCKDSAYSDGKYVLEFEKSFARYCSVKHAVGVNSGTSALHLALLSLGISKDDEVILPANTFISTAWAVSYVGAKIVFVDCEPDTWQICPIEVEKSITSKTKLIIGVHLYGQPFDIDKIKDIADKYGIYFIEDAAQAHGAKYKNKKIGSFGEMACFSFYPGKNLGTYGEGGCITTNNDSYNEKLRILKNHGSRKKYYHDVIGFNMRMSGIEGAILNVKLKYLDAWNKKRKNISKKYLRYIDNSKIGLPKTRINSDAVFHLFVITTDDRENLESFLSNKKISTAKHYPIPCHLQKAYDHLGYKINDFPNSEYLSNHCLSLPIFPEMEDEMVEKVIDELNKY